MLFASLALTAVLLLALSLLLNQRATALTSAIPNPTLAASLDAPLADSALSASAQQPAAQLAQAPSPTPTLAPVVPQPTADPGTGAGAPLYPQIELTDMPLPAEEQLRIFVQLLVASPTPLSSSAVGSQPTTLFVPMLSRSYGPPTYFAPAARDPEPFFSIDNLSTTSWPAASQMSESKLSVHAIGRGDPYMMEFVRSARPRIFKTVGDFGWMAEVKAVDPNIIVIGRVYGQDESWVLNLDPAAAATEYINRNLGHYQSNPSIDYWEGWNEFVWSPGEATRLQWFAQFESERACQMQARGMRAAVGGFAVGWPNSYAEFEHVLPIFEAANRCGAIFHLHEYNRPLMYCGVASNRPDLIPGAPAISQPAGPLTLRYRFWYEGWLRPRGLANVPLVISETGIDRVPATGDCAAVDPYPLDPSHVTWKHHGEWWVQNGVGPTSELAYINQLAWFDRELRHDSYVLGATIFTMGASDGGGWQKFDIHDAVIPLANYVASQR